MVPTPAPNSRRLLTTPDPQWTQRFVKASALRPGSISLWTITLGALLIPVFGLLPSQAQNEIPQTESTKKETASILPTPDQSDPKSKSETPDSQTASVYPVVPVAGNSSLLPSSQQIPSFPSQLPISTKPLAVRPEKSLDNVAPALQKPLQRVIEPTIRVRVVVSGQARVANIAVKPKMKVGPVLAAMGISLGALDRVMPDASALAEDGMTIRVARIQSQLKTRRVPIRAQVRFRPSTKIAAGRKQVTQAPRDGFFHVTERVWTRDGQVTKREFVSQSVGQEPRHQIVSLGTKSHLMPQAIRPHRRYSKALRFAALPASRGGSPLDRALLNQIPTQTGTFRIAKTIDNVLATGYSAGPAGGAIGNWTATGVRCTYGAVAVDPRLIPLGSKLYIEGYGYGFACDTGGAIKGKHIDLAFNSPRAAFAHGKKRMTVHILVP